MYVTWVTCKRAFWEKLGEGFLNWKIQVYLSTIGAMWAAYPQGRENYSGEEKKMGESSWCVYLEPSSSFVNEKYIGGDFP